MSDGSDIGTVQPRKRRRWLWALAGALVVALIAVAVLVWWTQTESFRRWAERKVVAAIEQSTGGKVDLRQLTFNVRGLRFQADGLVIHGTESPDQEPYVRVQRIVVNAKVLSWFGRQLALRSVLIEQPRVHVIVYPDGHTNVPEPQQGQGTSSSSQPVLDVKLDRAELHDGILVVNDRAIPFDFTAQGVRATVDYAAKAHAYEGTAEVANMHVAYGKLTPFDAAGSAQFVLGPNQLQVRTLELSSGQIKINATGTVSDFAKPHAEFQYVAQADVPQAAGILGVRELRRGSVALRGTANYAGDDFATTGKATFSDVEYRDASLFIPEMNGGADYTADKSTLSVPHFFARLLDGVATGNVTIDQWQLPGKEQRGTVVAKADNLSLARIAAAASTRDLPLKALNATGRTSGTVQVTWRRSPADALARFAFTVQPNTAASAEQMPVSGQVRGTYSVAAHRYEITQLEASGRSLQSSITGALARNANLTIHASGSVRDVAQVLHAWTGHEILPAGLAAEAAFQGTISGRMNAPTIEGHLALTNIDVPLPLQLPAPAATVMKPVTAVVPPRPSASPRRAHYDSASADIRYSPSELDIRNGVVQHGAEQATLSAAIGLVQGRFFDTDPIQARLSARNFQVQDLAALGGYTPPITGIVNGDADIHGTKDDPHGTAHFQLSNATVYGATLRSASANVTFADQKANFSDIVLSQDGGRITGSAEYNLQSTDFRFGLSGNNFHLAQIAQLQAKGVRTEGTLSFVARGSGTQSAPVIDANLTLAGLAINGQHLGDLKGTAKTTGGIMRIDALLVSPLAGAQVAGTVTMRDGFPADLTLQIAHLNAAPFLQMATSGRFNGESTLSGAVHLTGPLKDPRAITIDGDLGNFTVAIESVKVQNDGPLRFKVGDGVLRLQQFKIAGTDTTMTARGSVEFSGARTLDLRADGRVNLALVQSFNTDLHASGALNFDMRAAGTISRPTLFGTVRVENGTVTSINYPVGISAMNGTLIFNQDRGQIQQLSGTVGGGQVMFGGFVSYGNGLSFDVNGKATDVRLRYPQGFSETVNGDLRLTGTRVSSTLSGQLTVIRFNVSPQFDMAVAIAAAKAPPAPPDPTSWLNNLRLNVRVNSAPDLQLNTSLAKLSGDMSLTVRGTAIRPAVLGRINITEGQMSFNGATYQIDRGDITFSNPVKIEPVIDVAATTRVRDYDLTLGFHGPLDRLSTTYRSEPPLPTADIISLLAFGKTREEAEIASATQATFSESASNAILGQALNAAVGTRVQRLFGVSGVHIAPDVTGVNATDPNARVTIQQQVSKDFTVTYITDLTRSNQQQSIQVEYNYNRNVSIIGSRDQYGIISFDVRWRQRKR